MEGQKNKDLLTLSKNEKNEVNKIYGILSPELDVNKSDSYKKGYNVFGIFLIGFCQWLNKSVKENKIEKIFFLSRDGYIIKKAYDILYPNQNTDYLYVSRSSLLLPSLNDNYSIQELLDCMILPPSFKIKEFLNILDIDYDEKSINKLGIKENDVFYRKSFKTNEDLKMVLRKYKNEIKYNINIQKKNFCKYLKQKEFNNKVAVVDIGWHNSIQNYLIKIVENNNINAEIYGYYVGIYNNAKKIEGRHNASGFLYQYNDLDSQYKTFAFVSLFESMFLSNEGTILKYIENNKKIYPFLADYEYKDNIYIQNIVKDFQNGAIDFINKYLEKDSLESITITPAIAANRLINFGLYPSKNDIALFGNMYFENFSINNMINYNHNFFYYLFHLKELKNDFYKSGWRIVFLRKLIKLPFPYFSFFKLLCRVFLK